MRICKTCLINKEYIYFTNNSQKRRVYKDGEGSIWHGWVCYTCHIAYVKSKSNKTPLTTIVCAHCKAVVPQKTSNQKMCSLSCYNLQNLIVK